MSAPEDITKQKSSSLVAAAFFGASDVTRTRDLLITSEMHYRLCYTSVLCKREYYIHFLKVCQLFSGSEQKRFLEKNKKTS